MRARPKASDILDIVFIDAVREASSKTGIWANRWDVAAILDMPEKVVLAKAKRLIKRKVIQGCWCGCRGDFVVLEDPRDE